MQSFQDFLALGGYAAYVWPAILLTLAVLIWLAWVSLASLRRTQKSLKALEVLGVGRRRSKRNRGPDEA